MPTPSKESSPTPALPTLPTPAVPTPRTLADEIKTFVESHLPCDCGTWCEAYTGKRKIVHDALWGTFELEAHEVALLDTPLIQRLRFIRQTGAVYLTYPSAVHTRFEHTLGVTYLAGKMCSIFRKRHDDVRISDVDETNVRFAALMHDCGHGPFSHTSEQYFAAMPEITNLKSADRIYEHSGAGEILSSLVVLSEPFRNFVSALNQHFKRRISCDDVSGIITGSLPDDRMFLTEIIHGPFDADKLDYMHRDGLFSGLQMHVDLDRLFTSIDIKEGEHAGQKMTRLVGSLSGTSPLTQIMFNKMLLFTGMYHHHKVRAVDCMVWAIFDLAVTQGSTLGGQKLASPVDFLGITDDLMLIPELTDNKQIAKVIRDIRDRRLWKRALVIARRTMPESMHADAPDRREGLFADFICLAGNDKVKIDRRRDISEEIWKRADRPCERHEVWLDVPKLPPMDEARRMWIQAPGQDNPETLGEFVPITQWVELYGTHKWRSHVFCPTNVRREIADAAEAVFRDRFGLELNALARQYAGVD